VIRIFGTVIVHNQKVISSPIKSHFDFGSPDAILPQVSRLPGGASMRTDQTGLAATFRPLGVLLRKLDERAAQARWPERFSSAIDRVGATAADR
jgi:hypothetical protein